MDKVREYEFGMEMSEEYPGESGSILLMLRFHRYD